MELNSLPSLLTDIHRCLVRDVQLEQAASTFPSASGASDAEATLDVPMTKKAFGSPCKGGRPATDLRDCPCPPTGNAQMGCGKGAIAAAAGTDAAVAAAAIEAKAEGHRCTPVVDASDWPLTTSEDIEDGSDVEPHTMLLYNCTEGEDETSGKMSAGGAGGRGGCQHHEYGQQGRGSTPAAAGRGHGGVTNAFGDTALVDDCDGYDGIMSNRDDMHGTFPVGSAVNQSAAAS